MVKIRFKIGHIICVLLDLGAMRLHLSLKNLPLSIMLSGSWGCGTHVLVKNSIQFLNKQNMFVATPTFFIKYLNKISHNASNFLLFNYFFQLDTIFRILLYWVHNHCRYIHQESYKKRHNESTFFSQKKNQHNILHLHRQSI